MMDDTPIRMCFFGGGESEEFWRYWGCPHFEAHVMEFKRSG
jgi:hypothetical protein